MHAPHLCPALQALFFLTGCLLSLLVNLTLQPACPAPAWRNLGGARRPCGLASDQWGSPPLATAMKCSTKKAVAEALCLHGREGPHYFISGGKLGRKAQADFVELPDRYRPFGPTFAAKNPRRRLLQLETLTRASNFLTTKNMPNEAS